VIGMTIRTRYDACTPFVTKDGSTVRELMHPAAHGNAAQSLAEAVVAPGAATLLHLHRTSEELYSFTRGEGEMRLGQECFAVRAGDTVCIPPGTAHALRNTGSEPLVVLCSSSPPYSHGDTELLE
jgi:mannose-6-phosphate isomerase-like protein (cupin superfamily)